MSEVSAGELEELARAATSDPRALHELRMVDSVDGRMVDMESALRGVGGEELQQRLHALLSGGTGTTSVDALEARRAANAILEQDRFQPADVPQPLKGVFRQLGEWLQPVGEAITDVIDSLAETLPGGRATVWALLVVGGVAAIVGLARAIGRRRLRSGGRAQGRVSKDREDPDDLERAAAAAETSGDLETAVRLRFKAGLLRLASAKAIAWRPSLTSGQVARRIRSATFADLARSFDEIVYGHRPPTTEDVAAARTGWPRVLEEAA